MSDEAEHIALQNKVWAHIGWLQMYLEGSDTMGWKDAKLYAERQLSWLESDLRAYQKLMTERVHYAEREKHDGLAAH